MSEYNKYLENVYSNELITVDPDEFDEVQRLIVDEGCLDFSIELEQHAWQGSKQVSGILIKRLASIRSAATSNVSVACG